MDPVQKPTIISRLLQEISWEGSKVRQYRGGGRGMENVLTAEVLYGLSLLPREQFLGEVLRSAHGAAATRTLAASEVESASIDVLPDEFTLPVSSVRVQPDAWMATPSVQTLIEAKGFKQGAQFNIGQLAKEFLCVVTEGRNHCPLLLLILTTPPPIRVSGSGLLQVEEGIASGFDNLCERSGIAHDERQNLLANIADHVAWITWAEIHSVVLRQQAALNALEPSIAASLSRIADGVARSIEWHSIGKISPPLSDFAGTKPDRRGGSL